MSLVRMKTGLRTFLAFLAAAIAPGFLILLPLAAGIVIEPADPYAWERFTRLAMLILATSFLYVLVLGLPAFLVLRWRNAIRWWSVPVAAFVLGCLPVAIGNWPRDEPDLQTTSSHWDGERMVATMVRGVPTSAGWMAYAKEVAVFGFFGAVSGLAFWLVWWSMRPNKPMQATREDARA
jgi:hypothetical protein